MDEPQPVTPLDEALDAAKTDPKQASFFYDAFLNAELYFPVQRVDNQPPDWMQLGPSDRFHPLFLAFPQGKALPVFDSLGRMQDWAGEKTLDYAVVRGHQLLRMVDASIGMILNLATAFHYTLTPPILERLREAMKPVKPS